MRQLVSGRPSSRPRPLEVGDVTRVRSNFVNDIKKFPVRVDPLTPEVEH